MWTVRRLGLRLWLPPHCAGAQQVTGKVSLQDRSLNWLLERIATAFEPVLNQPTQFADGVPFPKPPSSSCSHAAVTPLSDIGALAVTAQDPLSASWDPERLLVFGSERGATLVSEPAKFSKQIARARHCEGCPSLQHHRFKVRHVQPGAWRSSGRRHRCRRVPASRVADIRPQRHHRECQRTRRPR